MADPQVEAMRKAYAGIMLNMAQESAARVLAAERRAAALAGALAAAKEDGVATLVRVKAIMDARVQKAELQSLAHLEKTKELEEQLRGAQSTVASLQVDCQRISTELEQTRKILAEERIHGLSVCNKIEYNNKTSACSKMHLQGGSVLLKNKKTAGDSCLIRTAKENGAEQNLENTYRCGPDLPSFMERNKKLKLYHSGCTQRIHALKQRTQGANASLEQNCKQTTAISNRSKTGKNDSTKNSCHTKSIMEQILQTKILGKCKRKRGRRSRPSYKHDSSGGLREAEYKSSDKSDGNGCLLLLQALEQNLSPPKVSAGHGGEALADLKGDLLMSRRGSGLNHCTASLELQDILAASNMQMRKKKRTKTIRVMNVGFSDSKSVTESGNSMLRSTGEKSLSDSEWSSEMIENCSDTPHRSNGPVSQCITENLLHQTDANNGQSNLENSYPVPFDSTKSETIDYGNFLVDQPEHKIPDNNSASLKEVNENEHFSLTSDRTDASTASSLDNEENLKACTMQALENPNASTGSSLNKEERAKSFSGASIQADGARHIKYTFNRRKRKSVSIESQSVSIDNAPQCAVPEERSYLVSSPIKLEPHPNPKTQNHLIESPQGDSQLAQVAQQLILLSGQI